MPLLSLRNAADTKSHELHLSFPTEGGVETSGWSWLFRTIIFDLVGVDSGFQLVFDQSSKVGWFYTGKDISCFFEHVLWFLVVCRSFLISSFLCHRQGSWYGIYCMSWYLAVIWLNTLTAFNLLCNSIGEYHSERKFCLSQPPDNYPCIGMFGWRLLSKLAQELCIQKPSDSLMGQYICTPAFQKNKIIHWCLSGYVDWVSLRASCCKSSPDGRKSPSDECQLQLLQVGKHLRCIW